MRLCTFRRTDESPGEEHVGMVEDSRIFEVGGRYGMIDILRETWDLRKLRRTGRGHRLEEVNLLAPVPSPGKIIAAIVNTRGMLGGEDIKLDRPRLDMKAPSTVVGPGAEIRGPKYGIRPEVELAAIVGRRISRASRAQAGAALFGYTILNDVTAPSDSREDAYEAYRRDKVSGQIRKTTLRGPLFRSKNHDTFCPMGPWLVTSEENQNWSDLRMTTKYGGILVQEGSTSEYIFGPADIASYVSGFLTLEPGDIISCGSVGWTPQALGDLDPTEFVLPRHSGTLDLEVEGIGRLRNPVSLN